MLRFLTSLANRSAFTKKSSPTGAGSPRRRARGSRPALEGLEGRQLLTVTLHGGPVLAHADVQPMFYGSDWSTSAYSSQVSYLNGFVNNISQNSYLPMLGNAGYTSPTGTPIGAGTSEAGTVTPTVLNKSTPLTDAAIQAAVQANITKGTLKAPSSNSLYVVYVEDNVVVDAFGQASNNGFLGYHSHFEGVNAAKQATDIHYAVIDYPGGSSGNYTLGWLSNLQTMTLVTSHELAEAATDPDLNAWYQGSVSGEVGDIVVGQTVYLDGYAVQKISDQNDQPMTPAGATANAPVSYVLGTNGVLQEHNASGWTTIATGVASMSDQAIDDYGEPMVDYVTTAGNAYEHHDGSATPTLLGSGIESAVAGNGVSYFITTKNVLMEYKDDFSYNNYGGTTATALDTLLPGYTISAGTDLHGVSTVYTLSPGGGVLGRSDSPWNANSNWFIVGQGIHNFSGGDNGYATYVTTNGNSYLFLEGSGNTPNANTFVASGTQQLTSGMDQNGNIILDWVSLSGVLEERKAGGSWTTVATGVQSISKDRGGLIDIVLNTSSCDEHSANGITFLASNIAAAG